MGFYGERVIPRIINVACGTKTLEPLRRRVCEGLAGEVVEIGSGAGLNVPFYPAAITRVATVEPSDAFALVGPGQGLVEQHEAVRPGKSGISSISTRNSSQERAPTYAAARAPWRSSRVSGSSPRP